MKQLRWIQHTKRVKNFIVMSAFVATQLLVPVATTTKVFAADPAGNNGTLQVHNLNSPVDTKSNEPKVCVFDFELFGVDANQTGTISVDTQGNGNTSTHMFDVPISTDANGNGEAPSPYINASGSTYTLAEGHYKATLDNKFGTDPDGKAKSKVFKVTCTAPTITTQASAYNSGVQAGQTVTDTATLSGTQQLGDVTGTVDFYVCGPSATAPDCSTGGTKVGNAVTIAQEQATSDAFTVPAAGTYCFRAEYTPDDNANYIQASHTNTTTECFTATAAPIVTPVTPTVPTMVDLTCNADGSYTIPSETGVTYSVNGKVTPAGTHAVTTPGTYTITAAPASAAYSLTGTTSWTFTFTAPTGCVQPPTVVTPQAVTFTQPTCQTPTGSYTIPSVTGVIYKVNNTVAGAGTHPVAAGTNVSITAEAASGYALANGATSNWSQTFTAVSGCVLGATDVCPNILGSQATVPNGYTKNSQGNCVTNSTPRHEHGQVLGASTTAQLANTGQSVWVNVVVGISVLATVLGLGLANRKNLNV